METHLQHGGAEVGPRRFNTYDALKIIALVAMTLDHLAKYLMPEIDALHLIGRIAAPVFCFLVGWNGQYRFRYALLLAAVLASVTDYLHAGSLQLTILWVILFGRMLLQLIDTRGWQPNPWMLVVACMIWQLPSLMLMEYGSMALIWMLWGQAQRRERGSRENIIYATFGGAAAGALSFFYVPFTPVMAAAVLLLTILMVMVLQRFTLKDIALPGAAVWRFWSRHALSYYVLHRAVLVAAAATLV